MKLKNFQEFEAYFLALDENSESLQREAERLLMLDAQVRGQFIRNRVLKSLLKIFPPEVKKLTKRYLLSLMSRK